MKRIPFVLALALAGLLTAAPAQAATYVGTAEVDQQFSQITAADMDIIRSKKVLLATRSYGLNMLDGITRLTNQDAKYGLDVGRALINRLSQPHSAMPTDIFTQHNVNQYLVPLNDATTGSSDFTERIDDLDAYLHDAPYQFGGQVDAVMLEYHVSDAATYAYYNQKMTQWKQDFPSVKFIYVTSGVAPAVFSNNVNSGGAYNADSWAFGDLVLADHQGVDPVMDWRDLLSTDETGGHTCGNNMCPQFNITGSDNNNPLHPNAAFIEERLGKALLVTLKSEFISVPEPASLSLVVTSVCLLAFRRRGRETPALDS